MSVLVQVAPQAENDIQVAIEWRSKATNLNESKQHIKSVLGDFSNQFTLYPESGRPSRFLPDSDFREAIKGDYLFLYELIKTEDNTVVITILAFCHQRMDFKTLLSHRNLQEQLSKFT